MKELINISLVGLMGSGKTTIGSFLSKQLNILYIDSDITVVTNYNTDIVLIYYIEGEHSFRAKEEILIEPILIKPNSILATGGGSVFHIYVCKFLLESNITLWFKLDVKEQSKRVASNKRPLTLSIRSCLYIILEHILKERHKLYLKVFNIVFNVNIKSYMLILNKVCWLM
ncbi:shikimate kinase [Candidatus Tremblaya phenacola]|uniref:Shikimate kinase n=1 Tax=Candidatus Tremblayella phenacoccinincola TaxID=1010676 RepID=A0A2G0V6N6_9PROT|nr:shikimate kinase [Candidatus Tremblaya phenacola]PHN16172.1 Shikimate kinase 1 [Candidatus Tremblaya phenacola]